MITAYQSRKLDCATHLRTAADEATRGLAMLPQELANDQRVHDAIEKLHAVFAELIPNTSKGD